MVVSCEDVWREVCDYIEGELDPTVRQAIEDHFRGCRRCTAVLDGTRNVIQLYGDERLIELPAGFSQRLAQKLKVEAGRGGGGRKIGWATWALVAAAAIIAVGGLAIARTVNTSLPVRSALAKPASDIPPELLVAVSGTSRVFHLPACGLIEGKHDLKTMKAEQAVREGLVPCVHCLHQYLSRIRRARKSKLELSAKRELEENFPDGVAAEPRSLAVRE